MDEIKDEVCKIVGKLAVEAGIDKNFLGDEVDLFELGVLDSLNIIRLLSLIEEHFQKELLAEDLIPQNLSTINQIVELVKRGHQCG